MLFVSVNFQAADFDWNSKTKGFVLSVFSIGYLFGPFGGVLALKYGGATIFGAGVALTALLTVLSPFLLRLNFYAFILGRLLEGIFEVGPKIINWSTYDVLK